MSKPKNRSQKKTRKTVSKKLRPKYISNGSKQQTTQRRTSRLPGRLGEDLL